MADLLDYTFGEISAQRAKVRRAYTAENFDESKVRRERGRFARQDEGAAYDKEFADKYGNDVPDGEGDCFETAYRTAETLEREGKQDAVLAHGVPEGQGDIAGIRFPHGWAEYTQPVPGAPEGGIRMVVDKSNGNDIEVPAALYYRIGNINPDDVQRYTTFQARVEMVKTGHWGPWA